MNNSTMLGAVAPRPITPEKRSGSAAIAGYPSITVPNGYVQGLPVGILFFGRAWSEPTLLRLAYAYEQVTGHRRAPKLPSSLRLMDRV